MSSFLCFVCHNTVTSDSNEETRDKYREVVGMNLCPDSHLCYICCHMLNKLWLFKSVCLKRSLEYPVLFSEKGTLNLQRNEMEAVIICSEENCLPTNISQVYADKRDHSIHSNDYTKLEEGHNDFDDYFREGTPKETEIVRMEEFENTNRQFENDEREFVENDENFVQNDEEFVGNNDEFVRNDENFESNDGHYSDENIFDCELSKDQGDEEHNEEEEEINYEYYEEERNECIDEIRNEIGLENTAEELDTAKKKNSKKKDFEKILLSTEEQKAELEAQRKSKKYLDAEFKCYNCAMGFLFKDSYQTHMMRHEESNGEYRCMLCSLRFATGAVLRSHSTLHSVRYRCSRCSEYLRPRQTQTHAKNCHDKASAATCHLCGRAFRDASGLQQHLKRLHTQKTGNRTYSCSVCGKSYNKQTAVRTHMIKHVHRKFSCDQCPSIFSSPYTLSQHKKKHSITEEFKEHYCTTCGIGYSSRKCLLAHQRQSANHQQRSYECPICNRACPNERSLTSHIAVHSATKPFHCTTCSKKYSSRKSLTRHVRAHTTPPQTKLAVCHLCGNSFKGKSKLNRHLREVCEKDKLEEELSSYYEQQVI